MAEMIGVRLALVDRDALEKLAKEERRTLSAIVRHIIRTYLRDSKKTELPELGKRIEELNDMSLNTFLFIQEIARVDLEEKQFKAVLEKVRDRKEKITKRG